MRTEASLLKKIESAQTLAEKRKWVAELMRFRKARSEQVAAERELDLAEAIIRDVTTPAPVHELHTAATDWLDEVVASSDDYDVQMRAKATTWFKNLHPAVVADRDEFAEQAMGMARRESGRYGEYAEEAYQAFLRQASRQWKQAVEFAPGEVDEEQSGNAESQVTDYDTEGSDSDPMFSEDFDGEDDTGSQIGSGVHPEMPGAQGSDLEPETFDNLSTARRKRQWIDARKQAGMPSAASLRKRAEENPTCPECGEPGYATAATGPMNEPKVVYECSNGHSWRVTAKTAAGQGIHLDSGPTDSRPLCGASNQAETTSDINFVTCDECYELHEQRTGGRQSRKRDTRRKTFDALNTKTAINVLDTCNVCDAPIEHPNPMGYCDEHLREIGATEYLARRSTRRKAGLREEYLDEAGGDPVKAAILLAGDLMVGEPETFKGGYSLDNAILAAIDIFPEVTPEQINPRLSNARKRGGLGKGRGGRTAAEDQMKTRTTLLEVAQEAHLGGNRNVLTADDEHLNVEGFRNGWVTVFRQGVLGPDFIHPDIAAGMVVTDLGRRMGISGRRKRANTQERLDHLRKQIENESISYGEIAELQDLLDQGLIPPGDLDLLQWAGLPEEDLDSYTQRFQGASRKRVANFNVGDKVKDASGQTYKVLDRGVSEYPGGGETIYNLEVMDGPKKGYATTSVGLELTAVSSRKASRKTAFTTRDIARLLLREDHLGWGYAASHGLTLEQKEALDEAVAQVATELGLSEDDFFMWLNSRSARWTLDYASMYATMGGDPVATVKKFLNASIVDSLRAEGRKKTAATPDWLRERNNDPYGTPNSHEFWTTVDFEDIDKVRVFEKDGKGYLYHRVQNYWMHFDSLDAARQHAQSMNQSLDMWATRKKAQKSAAITAAKSIGATSWPQVTEKVEVVVEAETITEAQAKAQEMYPDFIVGMTEYAADGQWRVSLFKTDGPLVRVVDIDTRLQEAQATRKQARTVHTLADPNVWKELESLPRLYATDGQKGDRPAVKLFDPYGSAWWVIWEYDPATKEGFGYAELFPGGGELGYVDVGELAELAFMGQKGLRIERDAGVTTMVEGFRSRGATPPGFLMTGAKRAFVKRADDFDFLKRKQKADEAEDTEEDDEDGPPRRDKWWDERTEFQRPDPQSDVEFAQRLRMTKRVWANWKRASRKTATGYADYLSWSSYLDGLVEDGRVDVLQEEVDAANAEILSGSYPHPTLDDAQISRDMAENALRRAKERVTASRKQAAFGVYDEWFNEGRLIAGPFETREEAAAAMSQVDYPFTFSEGPETVVGDPFIQSLGSKTAVSIDWGFEDFVDEASGVASKITMGLGDDGNTYTVYEMNDGSWAFDIEGVLPGGYLTVDGFATEEDAKKAAESGQRSTMARRRKGARA